MVLILFITSLVGLFVFFIFKILEMNTGKRIISVRFLDKSDIFLNRSFVRFKFYLSRFLLKLKKIPVFIGILRKYFVNKIKSLKDILIIKIVGYLNLDNIKNIEKSKGSVSLFLKKISEGTKTSINLDKEDK